MTEEVLRKGNLPRGRSPSGKGFRTVQTKTVRIRHVNSGIGCTFGEKCMLRLKEVDSQPNKKPKKSGGKGSVALEKNSKQLGYAFQDLEPLKFKSILRKSTQFFLIEAQRALLKKVPYAPKNRERKGPSQGVIQRSDPHERSLYAPKFEDRPQE